MKTKTKTIVLLLVSVLFLQGSCTREDDRCPTYKLPPATQTGANTIGCLVDGVVLIPKRTEWTWNQPPILSFKYSEETGELGFRIYFAANEKAYSCGYPKTSMRFVAVDIFSEGNIESNKFGAEIDIYQELYGSLKVYRFHSGLEGLTAGFEITKLVTTLNIISGTFFFDTYRGTQDYDPDDKLYITEGRFDFSYNQDGSSITD